MNSKMSRKDKQKWKEISTTSLTSEFIIENKDCLDLKSVCKYSKLSYSLINKLADKLDWANIVLYQNVEPEFIWNNAYRVNWDKVSNSTDLTEQHLEDYCSQLNWKIVVAKHKYNEDILLKYKKFVDWTQACISQDFSTKFLEENAILLHPYRYEIYKYQNLSLEYMEKHKDELDWDIISECQQLPENFIDKMSNYVNWTWISKKQKLSKKFIVSHKDKINFMAMIDANKYIPKEIRESDAYRAYIFYKNSRITTEA